MRYWFKETSICDVSIYLMNLQKSMSRMACYMQAPDLSILLAVLVKPTAIMTIKVGLKWSGGMVRLEEAEIIELCLIRRIQMIQEQNKEAQMLSESSQGFLTPDVHILKTIHSSHHSPSKLTFPSLFPFLFCGLTGFWSHS
jgi:hypothetical protein